MNQSKKNLLSELQLQQKQVLQQTLKSSIHQYTQKNSLADLIMHHYKDKEQIGTSQFFIQLENWLQINNQESSKPLIIKYQKDEEMQPIITNWMYKHIQDSQKDFQDVIVPIFVNYANKESQQYALIYEIVLRIREIFNIQQSIERSQEKLRINFSYWIDLASRKIKSNKFFDGDLILVIDGADLISEQNQNVENNLKFWIPQFLPERVKLIITLKEHSYNLNHFQNYGCQFIDFCPDFSCFQQKIEQQKSQQSLFDSKDSQFFIDEINKKIQQKDISNFCYAIFQQTLLLSENTKESQEFQTLKSIILGQKNLQTFKQEIQNMQNSQDLLITLFKFYEDKITKKNNFILIIGLLCYNYQGLKFSEIHKITKAKSTEIKTVIFLFREFILQHNNLLKISSPIFINTFQNLYYKNPSSIQEINRFICDELEKTPDSLRKLEEQTNNFYRAKDFFNLKQKLSQIENFLILYNQHTKYDLFKFWSKLESKGYDPVFEYNKSYELFEMHYNPKDKDIFMINIQLCRFFKELSEFEGNLTPDFRHPFIKDKIIQNVKNQRQLQMQQNKNKNKMIQFDNKFNIKECKNTLDKLYKNYSNIFYSEQNRYEQNLTSQRSSCYDDEEQCQTINYLKVIGIFEELQRLDISGNQNQILQEHEKMNINIPLNLEKFLGFFKNLIELKYQYLNRVQFNQSSNDFDTINSNQKNSNQQLIILEKKKDPMDALNKQIRMIDLTIEPTKPKMYYYYKRWIWMNFPIICLSKEKNEFSDIIYYCYHNSNSSLTFEQEKNIYLKSLDVVFNCKQKKDQVLNKLKEKFQMEKQISRSFVAPSVDNGFQNQIIRKSSVNRFSQNNLSKKNSHSVKYLQNNQNTIDSRPSINLPNIPKNTTQKQFQKSSFLQKKYSKLNQNQRKKISLITVQDNEAQENIKNVLRKSQMFEDSVMKRNINDLSKSVFAVNKKGGSKNICKQKTKKLASHFTQYNNQQTNVVEKKKQEIIKEFNKVKHDIQEIGKQIQKQETKKLEINKGVEQEQKEQDGQKKLQVQEKEIFEEKIQQMKQKYYKVLDQKNRYQAIIDICHINQIQNEDWIRNLNYYLSNLKKVCEDQKSQIVSKRIQKKNKKKESDYILNEYQQQQLKQKLLITNFKKHLKQKLIIDKTLMDTDNLILKNIKEDNQSCQKQKVSSSRKKFIMKSILINKQIEEKLQTKKEFLTQFQDIFYDEEVKENEDIVQKKIKKDWHKSKKFQELLFQIQIHKDLEKSNYELQLQLIDEKKKNEYLICETQNKKQKKILQNKNLIECNQNNVKENRDKQNLHKKIQDIYQLRNLLSLGLESILSQLNIDKEKINDTEKFKNSFRQRLADITAESNNQ